MNGLENIGLRLPTNFPQRRCWTVPDGGGRKVAFAEVGRSRAATCYLSYGQLAPHPVRGRDSVGGRDVLLNPIVGRVCAAADQASGSAASSAGSARPGIRKLGSCGWSSHRPGPARRVRRSRRSLPTVEIDRKLAFLHIDARHDAEIRQPFVQPSKDILLGRQPLAGNHRRSVQQRLPRWPAPLIVDTSSLRPAADGFRPEGI
jgi:hypothetical protein